MSGNVWEWTLDAWQSNYHYAPSQAETPRIEPLPSSRVCDNESLGRVHHGGSWGHTAWSMRVTNRRGGNPNVRFNYIGLRVRRTIP